MESTFTRQAEGLYEFTKKALEEVNILSKKYRIE
jgi:hypothetical protein